mgnify:CR=1 FL=1
MANFTRRKFLQATGGAVAVSSLGFPAIVGAASKKVIVIGGGVGGATAARYIRMSDPSIDVTLIESMTVDTELYLASIGEVLGSVRFRGALSDYEHVTDNGILAQVLDDNGYPFDEQTAAAIKAIFVDKIERHIETEGPFSTIHGAIEFFERTRVSDGRRVAIATGGWRESARLKLESAGFDIDGIPLVTEIVGAHLEIRTQINRLDRDAAPAQLPKRLAEYERALDGQEHVGIEHLLKG